MNFSSILTKENVLILEGDFTKKRILDVISKILTKNSEQLDANNVLQQFIARERLGSTALGHGIALPHIRINEVTTPRGCLLLLKEAIDYDSPDNLPVDIFFGLIVPENSKETHLEILAKLAELFSNKKFCKTIRACDNAADIYKQLLTCSLENTSEKANAE